MNTGPERSVVERAIDLSDRGWSYRKIAKRLQVSVGTAFNYVNSAYEADPEVAAKREARQAKERARLDRIIRRVDRALRSPDHEIAVKAAAVLIKASESRRKLDGLDAPTKTQAVEPDAVAKMTPAEKLAAHERAAEELRREIAEGKDGMH